MRIRVVIHSITPPEKLKAQMGSAWDPYTDPSRSLLFVRLRRISQFLRDRRNCGISLATIVFKVEEIFKGLWTPFMPFRDGDLDCEFLRGLQRRIEHETASFTEDAVPIR